MNVTKCTILINGMKHTTRNNRKAQGLCITCGLEPLVPGKTRGVLCADKERKYANKHWSLLDIETKKRLSSRLSAKTTRINRNASGLCIGCGLVPKGVGKTRCQSCLDTEAQNGRKRRKRMSVEEKKEYNNKMLTRTKLQRLNFPNRVLASRERSLLKLKLEAFQHYGKEGKAVCVCPGCNEDNTKFLTLDHINNDGAAWRKVHGPGYRKLRQLNWPPGLQTMCYNCNCGRFRNNGVCPHLDKS